MVNIMHSRLKAAKPRGRKETETFMTYVRTRWMTEFFLLPSMLLLAVFDNVFPADEDNLLLSGETLTRDTDTDVTTMATLVALYMALYYATYRCGVTIRDLLFDAVRQEHTCVRQYAAPENLTVPKAKTKLLTLNTPLWTLPEFYLGILSSIAQLITAKTYNDLAGVSGSAVDYSAKITLIATICSITELVYMAYFTMKPVPVDIMREELFLIERMNTSGQEEMVRKGIFPNPFIGNRELFYKDLYTTYPKIASGAGWRSPEKRSKKDGRWTFETVNSHGGRVATPVPKPHSKTTMDKFLLESSTD